MPSDTAFTCTLTSLTLHRPVAELMLPQQALLRPWLARHWIDPDHVAIEAPILRDARRRTLLWSEPVLDDGFTSRSLCTRHLPGAGIWPRPFPADLLSPAIFTDADGYTFAPG